jgi:DNA-binding CsgD family transcriptional regulator
VTPHAAVVELTTSPTGPAKILVSGGIGTGKTSLLTEMRAALRAAGVAVIARPPRDGDPASVAVVVDDAHSLGGDELEQLVDLVGDPAATLVVAAEPLVHRRELTALTSALARTAPAVLLNPLTPAELSRAAVDILGSAPPVELLRAVVTASAGLPFLAYPAFAAIGSLGDDAGGSLGTTVSEAIRVALIERLRRVDEAVLDTLLVSSLSPELGADDVAAALDLGAVAAQALVDRARASGLIAPSHSDTFSRSLHQCLAEIIGAARHRDVELALLRSQIEKSTLSMDLALRMADHGLRDTQLADALIDFADRSQAHPERVARLYRAAAQVGTSAVSARLAEALALTGDCGTAGRLADDLMSSSDPDERAAAVRIAASVAMHDGAATHAAELFRWLGAYPNAAVGAAGAIVSAGVGDIEATRVAASTETEGPPTSSARAARSLAEGLAKTLDSPYETAISLLAQAIGVDSTSLSVSPDTPAALVTLAALHAGDAVRARSVIGRAVGVGAVGGTNDGFFGHRHRLLLGWVHMQEGQLSAASAQAMAVTDPASDSGSPVHLHRRDALWAAALQTGIARRSGDSGWMQKHWYAAMEVLTEYSMDLYSLLPLGELWIVAARMHQLDRIDHSVAEAFKLLERLGNPVLWSLSLHWAGVHAGILANSPVAVAPHGQALSAAAGNTPLARALATAGRAWLRVLANQVDADEVTAAARSLAQFGLAWDATRLASQAALQTPDARVSGAMLQLARDLKVSIVDQAPAADVAGVPAPSVVPQRVSPIPASSRLSEREREVAALLLQGMPYRDIGSQLFISAKTVEHHVARIRRRLGAESRSELLSMLRAALGSPT